MGLNHPGEGGWEYGDNSGHMGIGIYETDRCFNAAKSYQLRWYHNQVKTMNTLDPTPQPTKKPISTPILTPIPTAPPSISPTKSFSKPPPTKPETECNNDTPFHAMLLTDNYRDETGWGFWDEEEGDWALFPDDNFNFDSNILYHIPSIHEDYCLAKGGCYQFVLEDTATDGICRSLGECYFKLTLDRENIYKGGEITDTSVEIHQFCIADDLDASSDPTKEPSYSPTGFPTGDPPVCRDDLTFRFKNKKKRTCAWIGKKKRRARKRFCKKKIRSAAK